MLWRSSATRWTFAAYRWNEAQTDAELVPEDGFPDAAEVAPGRRHTIPSIEDCRACHDSARTEILGFSALQLSTDRDPLAPHAEPLAPGMVTLQTLLDDRVVVPNRPELVTMPPRIQVTDARTRAVLGYLSSNCGSCHNEESSLASLGLFLRARIAPSHLAPSDVPSHLAPSAPSHPEAVRSLLRRTAKWQIPHTAEGASAFVTPGAPDLSALFVRMRSRRPSSQMPPFGTVLHDQKALDLIDAWIRSMRAAD